MPTAMIWGKVPTRILKLPAILENVLRVPFLAEEGLIEKIDTTGRLYGMP
jgi:hypothetical protein